MIEQPLSIQSNASLKPFNTFRFDYQAQYLAVAESLSQLVEAVEWARSADLSVTVIGGGSNLLIRGDVSGLVIVNRLSGIERLTTAQGVCSVRFMAGEVWHDCVRWSVDQGLAGIENLALIPGTAGAAPVQNIGAYGVEIKDTLHSLEVLDITTLERHTLLSDQCCFGYRDSRFKHDWRSKYIILSITLRLSENPVFKLEYGGLKDRLTETPSLKDVFDCVCRIRQAKLPDPKELANAGSFFKNPVVTQLDYESIKNTYPEVIAFPVSDGWKLAAGWLNERLGWKGMRAGDVGVYDKQALVLVNYGDSKADALISLEQEIESSVYKAFGVQLEREPVMLGESLSD